MLVFCNECIFSENNTMYFDDLIIMRLFKVSVPNRSQAIPPFIFTKNSDYHLNNDFSVIGAITTECNEL